MRVIAGHLRSRLLTAPPGNSTRPTSDRLRETIFNVLAPRIAQCRFADLYAGSGAVGIEALSRGAEHCFFAERAPAAVSVLRKNLSSLELTTKASVEARPVAKALAEALRSKISFDIVFLDPPYDAEEEYSSTLRQLGDASQGLLRPDALVVVEHARRFTPAESYRELRRRRLLEQGDAAVSFYAVERE